MVHAKKGIEMKAIDGKLRVDQSYSLEETYTGLCFCDNCGNRLHNIAVVTGSEDNLQYRIGLDCASTLVGIKPNEIKKAQKAFALRRKVNKRIKNGFYKKAFVVDSEWVWLYTKDVNDHYLDSTNWFSKMKYQNVKDSLCDPEAEIETIYMTGDELLLSTDI